MPNDTIEQFVARVEFQDELDSLRRVSNHPQAHKYERYLLECPDRGEDRVTLVRFARTQMQGIFVATVGVRGFAGKRRTVLLEDLHIFGCKFVQESHLWFVYDNRWERIEPFYQGRKVVLVGTAIEYTRKNGTRDYTLAIEKVTKLWL
jgi:hypothetical protein